MAVAQWIRCGSSSHRVVHAGGLKPGGDPYQSFCTFLYQQNFKKGLTPVAVAQWIRRGSSSHRVVHAGGLNPSGDSYQFFFLTFVPNVLQ